MFDSIEELSFKLTANGYFVDDPVMIQVVYLAARFSTVSVRVSPLD